MTWNGALRACHCSSSSVRDCLKRRRTSCPSLCPSQEWPVHERENGGQQNERVSSRNPGMSAANDRNPEKTTNERRTLNAGQKRGSSAIRWGNVDLGVTRNGLHVPRLLARCACVKLRVRVVAVRARSKDIGFLLHGAPGRIPGQGRLTLSGGSLRGNWKAELVFAQGRTRNLRGELNAADHDRSRLTEQTTSLCTDQHGDRLDGLAEAHFVGQNAVHACWAPDTKHPCHRV